jgi:predicted O-methyltransferase YrrM
MKGAIDAILRRQQAEYLDRLLPERDPLLAEMERYAADEGHPIADPEVARLLRLLVRIARPRRILEIGTNIGYSVIVMARELGADTVVESIEIDCGILDAARGFVARAGLQPRIVFHEGAAIDIIRALDRRFDFVFIDCVKSEYEAYLDLLLPDLAPGAVIVCDNLLWKGQVAEGARNLREEASTAALRKFNRRIMEEPRLLSTVIPVGDGVGISVVV